MILSRRKFAVLALIVGYIIAISWGAFVVYQKWGLPKKKGEEYSRLEFRIVHRPHVTYFVDLKYMLCFATTKPTHTGLLQIPCTDSLIAETAEVLKVEGAP